MNNKTNRNSPPLSGFLSPENGGTEGGKKTIEPGGAVALANPSLEQGLLSALIWDTESDFSVVTDGLTTDCFTDKVLGRLFTALGTMHSQGMSIHNPMLILDTMNRTAGDEPEIPLAEFLQMVQGDSARAEIALNIPHYARILIDLMRRRRAYRELEDAIGRVTDLMDPIDDALGHLVSRLTEDGGDTRSQVLSFGEMVSDLQQTIHDNAMGNTPQGIATGIRRLDSSGGLHLSDLVIIAADSSQGKTALATTMAMNIISASVAEGAIQPNIAYYSMEMTPRQVVARMVSHSTGISGNRMIYTRLDDREQRMFAAAAVKLPPLADRLYIDDRSTMTPDSILQSIRYLHARYGVNIAIVDYLQILGLHTSRGQTREQVIAEAARRFKNIAKELNIVVILLSQLNRENSLQNPVPSVARIRDSGEVNESADLTLLIYRPQVYERTYPKPWENVSTNGTAMITVAKDRHGSYGGIGSFLLGFNPEQSYFFDLTQLPIIKTDGAEQQKPW